MNRPASSNALQITFLGSGTSHGVPMIGCRCPVCRSTDPHDRRTRPSVLVRFRPADAPPGGRLFNLLIDTSMDFRQQCLREGIRHLDAICYTHGHADHLLGLDDVRVFTWRNPALPVYAARRVQKDIRRVFPYMFEPDQPGGGVARFQLHPLRGPVSLAGLKVIPIPVWHGPQRIFGFRLENFAYITDCKRLPPASMALLAGVDTLVLGALRPKPHPTHLSLPEAIDLAHQLGARRTWFTHIAHHLGHAATNAALPAGMRLAYDGLTLRVPRQPG